MQNKRNRSDAMHAASRWTSIPPGETTRARCLTAFTLCLTLLLPLHLHAGSRRRAVSSSPPSDPLTIAFVDAPGGTLHTGTITRNISNRRGSNGNAMTKKSFGIRIGPASREANGSATLRAFLETADPRCIVRIDGIVLSTQPMIIERFAPLGIVTTHRLEIEVPTSAAEGEVVTSIGWDVSTD